MIGRREFITLLGVATVARPLTARAERSAAPLIGYLSSQGEVVETGNVAAA